MSIITTAQAVPSRLFSVYSTLFDSVDGEQKDRIEAWATPPSLSARHTEEEGDSATTLFSNTLLEARKLGLVEDVDDKLRIPSDARGGGEVGRGREQLFREYLLRTLFDPVRATETQQTGFMLALSWFLNLNPLKPIGFASAPQIALKAEIGDQFSKTELTSLNRYQNFLYWARYLGFATIVGGREAESNARRAIPDPLRVIASVLDTIFAKDNELPIETFLQRLNSIFPVFEGGSVRQEYESMLISPRRDGNQRLSIATSIALQRLADRQQITINSTADAPALILDFGLREGRVTHVGRKEVN